MQSNNVFQKQENKFDPNKLSINANLQPSKLKNPIEIKKNKKQTEKERAEKERIVNKEKREKLFNMYRDLNRKTSKTTTEKDNLEKEEKAKRKKLLRKIYSDILTSEMPFL